MLLPALQKARDKAHDIGCISSLKQIGLMTMLYADSNKNYYPYFNMMDPVYSIYTLMKPYDDAMLCFYGCPSRGNKVGKKPTEYAAGEEYSYGYNHWNFGSDAGNGAGGTPGGKKVTCFKGGKHPSNTVIWQDASAPQAQGIYSWSGCDKWANPELPDSLASKAHLNGSVLNVAWCDGHVSAEGWKQLFMPNGSLDGFHYVVEWAEP